jgi:hypothetical protein
MDRETMDGSKKDKRLRWLTLLAWSLFAAGLLIQVFAPRLEISDGAFVIPARLTVEGQTVRPNELVARERWLQSISAILTVSGALALAYCYRHSFMRRRQKPERH